MESRNPRGGSLIVADLLGAVGLVVYAKTSPGKRHRTSKAMRSIVRNLHEVGIQEDEFDRAVQQFRLVKESESGRLNYWMELLDATRLRLGDAEKSVYATELLDELTLDEVQQYLERHIRLDQSIEIQKRRKQA